MKEIVSTGRCPYMSDGRHLFLPVGGRHGPLAKECNICKANRLWDQRTLPSTAVRKSK